MIESYLWTALCRVTDHRRGIAQDWLVATLLSRCKQRQSTLRRISAECTVLLVDKDGARASLDGVLIAEWPGRLRIRVWKLGQAVFDLTLIESETWLLPPRPDRPNSIPLELRNAHGTVGPEIGRAPV